VKVLAEISLRAGSGPPAGTLRRCDLEAYERLLDRLAGSRAVLTIGEPGRRRAVAIGLAAAAAAAGTRTALLECDLGQPAIAGALGLAPARGLHEYLRGEAEAEGILDSLVLAGPGARTAVEPLVCVVAGRPAPEGTELLDSERFRHAVAKLRAGYELLVLAGPDADGHTLAGVADTALACVGRNEPAPEVGVPLAGLVVHD
jgi:Mrp family chromosome partitioning ATPase